MYHAARIAKRFLGPNQPFGMHVNRYVNMISELCFNDRAGFLYGLGDPDNPFTEVLSETELANLLSLVIM